MSDRAVRISRQGGPEVLTIEAIEVGDPGPGEIRIRHAACGLNYIDIYHRSGAYPLPMPSGLGMEGAGIVEAVGEGVTHLKPGDRAAYACQPVGAYATARVMPARSVVRLPEFLSFEQGAAIRCNNLPVLAYKIDQLLSSPARMATMQQCALRLARPHAAREIVRVAATLQ